MPEHVASWQLRRPRIGLRCNDPPPRGVQARTYPDLLAGPHDEALFEHYMTSQLVLVSVRATLVHAHRCVTMLGPSRCGPRIG